MSFSKACIVLNFIAFLLTGPIVVFAETMYIYSYFDSTTPPSPILFLVKVFTLITFLIFLINYSLCKFEKSKISILWIVGISFIIPVLSYGIFKLIIELLAKL